jgi:hypothetical protein
MKLKNIIKINLLFKFNNKKKELVNESIKKFKKNSYTFLKTYNLYIDSPTSFNSTISFNLN